MLRYLTLLSILAALPIMGFSQSGFVMYGAGLNLYQGDYPELNHYMNFFNSSKPNLTKPLEEIKGRNAFSLGINSMGGNFHYGFDLSTATVKRSASWNEGTEGPQTLEIKAWMPAIAARFGIGTGIKEHFFAGLGVGPELSFMALKTRMGASNEINSQEFTNPLYGPAIFYSVRIAPFFIFTTAEPDDHGGVAVSVQPFIQIPLAGEEQFGDLHDQLNPNTYEYYPQGPLKNKMVGITIWAGFATSTD